MWHGIPLKKIGYSDSINQPQGVKKSLRDFRNIVMANVVLFFMLSVSTFLIRKWGILQELDIPLSILVIHFLLNVIILIISRFLFKEFYQLLFIIGHLLFVLL